MNIKFRSPADYLSTVFPFKNYPEFQTRACVILRKIPHGQATLKWACFFLAIY